MELLITQVCASGCVEIAKRKLQAAVLRMVVVSDAERDIDVISGQQRRFLKAFGHVSAESIEGNLRSEI